MTKATLTEITDVIVDICTEASERGEQLTCDEIFARIGICFPEAQGALIERAFPVAVARLRSDAAQSLTEANELDAELQRRRNA